MPTATLLVTFDAESAQRRTIEAEVPDEVAVQYAEDRSPERLSEAIAEADALLSRRPREEFPEGGFARLGEGQFLQTISAGVDHLHFSRFPPGLTILNNAGAYAEPMAEHVLAMYLALSKRLLIEHRKLEAGEFDQFQPNERIAGSTCAILGFGAIGEATARLLKPLGVSVLAINRSGESDEPADFLGTPDDLESVARRCDCLVISAPLTSETRRLVDREVLTWLPDDGMLINVARGELIDQGDLYEHLEANPGFRAGLEAWWTEPIRHGEFDLEYPLLDLPNVLGCPHNSAQVPGIHEEALRLAVSNVVDAVIGGGGRNEVDPERGY